MTDPKPIDWDDLWRVAHADAADAAKELPTLQGKAAALHVERHAAAEHAAVVAARADAANRAADKAHTTSTACAVISGAAQTPSGRAALMCVLMWSGDHAAMLSARARGLIDAQGWTPLAHRVRAEILRLTTPKETDQ
jgi:hypothetical protein